jgi:hypothetical protein
MKKYKILKDSKIKFKGRTLYRIQALGSFGDVQKGDIGGYIEKHNNLSHQDKCWIYGNAKVFNDAKVFGDVKYYTTIFMGIYQNHFR